MPEQISVSCFLDQTWDDYKSPTTSVFQENMGKYKETLSQIEEELDTDRSELNKLKKSVRALYNTTSKHAQNEKDIGENLDRIGKNSSERHKEIKSALLEFSKVTKVLATLIEDLSKSLYNNFQFPLETILKGDIKGVKGDLRKPFDKAAKDYESKFSKIEKEAKKRAAEQGLLYRSDLKASDVADDMQNERKVFQHRMCRYLIKVNEIKTKKGVDLLNYMSEYYKAVKVFFEKGKAEVEKHLTFVDDLGKQIKEIKQTQKQEQTKLQELETQLQSSMTSFKEPVNSASSAPGYSLHQMQGNKTHGSTKDGYLLKKSEGMLKKIWQKRKCKIKDGIMFISHSDETKEPVRLNLLTCQVKLVSEDPGKKCFDVVTSHGNRTYHFQADDEKEMEQWISVLSNAKEEVLLQAFKEPANPINESVRELTKTIIDRIMKMPDNRECVDCGAPDPKWLSTNLGVLICLECCGIHRNLGVHISRTQSLEIDQLGTSQLLLARVIGNDAFNDILEGRLRNRELKPKPNSPMQEREDFIKAKYIQHKFTIQICSDTAELHHELQQAIQTGDIQNLLQVYAEGADLMSVMPDSTNDETGLHLAIKLEEECTTLHIVDFIVQNSNINGLSRQTRDGNTCLHLCAMLNKSECMKCLLRTKSDIANIKNNEGQTALDIANENKYEMCAELLKAAMAGKKNMFEHINIEWDLMTDDGPDYSDDELEQAFDRRPRSRPSSLIGGAEFPVREGSPRDRSDSDTAHRHIPAKPRIPGLPNHTSQLTSNAINPPSQGKKSPDNPPLPPRKKLQPLPGNNAAISENSHVRQSSDPETDIPYTLHRRTPSEPPMHLDHRTEARNTVIGTGFSSQLDLGKPAVPPRPRVSSEGKSDEPPPVPAPRKPRKPGYKRCEALYDCDADNEDELTFREGEIIVLLREEEEEWWEGEVENQPHRRGLFPISFVKPLPE